MRNQTKLDLAKSTEAQPDLQNKKKNCDRCATHMGWHLRWLWVVMSTKTMIHGGDGVDWDFILFMEFGILDVFYGVKCGGNLL